MQIKNAMEFIMAKQNKLIQLALSSVQKKQHWNKIKEQLCEGGSAGVSKPHFNAVSALSTKYNTRASI